MAKTGGASEVKRTPRSLMVTVAGWELTGTLGRGSYAHVRGAVHRLTRERMACKIEPTLGTPQSSYDTDSFVDAINSHKELVLLKALQGGEVPGVIAVEGVHYRDCWSYVIMPRYKHTTYKLQTDQAPPSTVIPFFRKLLLTVKALHDLHISHGDLKPSNILIDAQGSPVLVDYGFSQFTPYDDMVKSGGGTVDYESPEKAADVWHDPRASDIWALGILLLQLLGRPHPYEGDKLVDRVLHGTPRYEWTRDDLASGGLADLIRGMLHRDPGERFHITRCLKHPYFRAHSRSRLSTDLYTARSSATLPQLPHQLPEAVVNDLLFLAYICNDFVLCQLETVVLDNLKDTEPRWEKVWVGMIYDGWCALRRKESKRRPPGWRTSSSQTPVEVATTKLKRIDLSPIGDLPRSQPRTPRRELQSLNLSPFGDLKILNARPPTHRTPKRQALAPKADPTRDPNIQELTLKPTKAEKADKAAKASVEVPKGPRNTTKTTDAVAKVRNAGTREADPHRLGPPRRPGLRPSVQK